jgi:hypothetical protein
MHTEDQLASELRTQLRHETADIEPRTDLLDSLRRRQSRRSLTTRIGFVAAPVAAAAVAAALVVSGMGGTVASRTSATSGNSAKSAVLTAAMVQRVTSQSRTALATSGRATIAYRLTDNGTETVSGSDIITFAGHNWNDVVSQTFPASKGQAAQSQTAINRIVGNQFYLLSEDKNGHGQWIHDTNSSGHPSVQIPDPRSLFGLLQPSADFKVVGHEVVHGVRLTELSATKSPELRALNWLPGAQPGAKVKSLTVAVDSNNVVHQMSLRVKYAQTTKGWLYMQKGKDGSLKFVVPNKSYLKAARAKARQLRKHYRITVGVDPSVSVTVSHDVNLAVVSVTFVGGHQVITAPQHSTSVFSRG